MVGARAPAIVAVVAALLACGSCDRSKPVAGDRSVGSTVGSTGGSAAGATTGSATAAAVVAAFQAPLLDGGELDTGKLVGKQPFVLVFWSTWCDPCVAQAPHLVAFAERYRDRVAIISVATDAADEHPALRALIAKHRIAYPVAVDLEGQRVLPKFSSSTGLPLVLVVDGAGRVQLTQRNYKPGDERALEAAIERVATKR